MPFGSPGRKQALVTSMSYRRSISRRTCPRYHRRCRSTGSGRWPASTCSRDGRPEIHRLNRCVTTGRDVDGPPPRISEVALVVHPPPGPTGLQTELGIRGLTPDARDHPALGELPVVEEV